MRCPRLARTKWYAKKWTKSASSRLPMPSRLPCDFADSAAAVGVRVIPAPVIGFLPYDIPRQIKFVGSMQCRLYPQTKMVKARPSEPQILPDLTVGEVRVAYFSAALRLAT
jgi:hypothetical protein